MRFTIGRPFAGFICLILHLTLIGWILATICAVHSLGQTRKFRGHCAREVFALPHEWKARFGGPFLWRFKDFAVQSEILASLLRCTYTDSAVY
ncbi:hypothetical protein P3W85_09970 [Cupriavidus basilensis]|uniref:Secreted protein n=1 Tax=Cupriavidus basilensis TaxID=68895 RepID=A0ABT6AKY9_9BURK|nr:hypothetical protein [Cupriavidus basilensis]MDF3833270.1 hypothetical protein [Cupriavidus basilensis]